MPENLNILVTSAPPGRSSQVEICEHKGDGHPDSICDGVAEAVSHALCRAYMEAYGEIRHHNVDKALLIGGQSVARFGGGRIDARMRLIIAGRADGVAAVSVPELVCAAAQNYLAKTLRCPAALFDIESAVRPGSPNLRRVFGQTASVPVANDTSFGVGFAPFSRLENIVLHVAGTLRSAAFSTAFPAAGNDFKIMGLRTGEHMRLTIALAFIDRHVRDAHHYFSLKDAMTCWLAGRLPEPCELRLNTLDAIDAIDESGLYLTVTGLSAEHGDDGQVGRGNRVSGLITPSRPMSLEAAAGKNPVSHVGKIYNVLAPAIAQDLVAQIPGCHEAAVQLLSELGAPVNRPQIIAIRIVREEVPDPGQMRHIEQIVRDRIDRIPSISRQLAYGELRVF